MIYGDELRIFQVILTITCSITLYGCAENSYFPPSANPQQESSRIIDAPSDVVWQNFTDHLKRAFVEINSMDRQSGYIGLSYNGDPEKFVDCGSVRMKSAFGKVEFDVASNKWQQPTVTRQEILSGRVNIFVKPVSSSQTEVSVRAHYSMVENFEMHTIDGLFGTNQLDRTIAEFDSGESASFGRFRCMPTGLLETRLLDLGSAPP